MDASHTQLQTNSAPGDGFVRRVIRVMRWVLTWRNRLRPRVRTHLLLGLEIPRYITAAPREGVRLAWVDSPDSPHLDDLIDIAAHQGMDRAWCLAELGRDNAMLLIYARTQCGIERPAGAGWLNGGSHYMDETFHHFDVGPRGCHLMNAIILPQFRGRRLQRLLTRERLARAAARGKRWAYTVVAATNAPSLRNSLAEGHRPSLRIMMIEWCGLRVALLRRLTHRLPLGKVTFNGWPRAARWAHMCRG